MIIRKGTFTVRFMNSDTHKTFPTEAEAHKAAQDYVGNSAGMASMTSDLSKHEDFRSPGVTFAIQMGMLEINRGPAAVRHWVEGFN